MCSCVDHAPLCRPCAALRLHAPGAGCSQGTTPSWLLCRLGAAEATAGGDLSWHSARQWACVHGPPATSRAARPVGALGCAAACCGYHRADGPWARGAMARAMEAVRLRGRIAGQQVTPADALKALGAQGTEEPSNWRTIAVPRAPGGCSLLDCGGGLVFGS